MNTNKKHRMAFRTSLAVVTALSGISHIIAAEQIDPAIAAAIKAATKYGDVYSVSQRNQEFDGQILKVDTLTFQADTDLVITKAGLGWVAIVAKSIQFTEPNSRNRIIFLPNWVPSRYSAPDQPTPPPQTAKSGTGGRGTDGSPGWGGAAGHTGDHAPQTPVIYLFAEKIVNKTNSPVPEAFNLGFDIRGLSGGDGGNGGVGSDGGRGGDGGDGDYHSIDKYPFDSGCKSSAGAGGFGGLGGIGGNGGAGGNGSNGATIYWVGPLKVLESLRYSRTMNQPGLGGGGGISGASGKTGQFGARGSHPGTCGGGDFPGAPHATPITPVERASDGKKGDPGLIQEVEKSDISEYY